MMQRRQPKPLDVESCLVEMWREYFLKAMPLSNHNEKVPVIISSQNEVDDPDDPWTLSAFQGAG
jgi:hypothetical protein